MSKPIDGTPGEALSRDEFSQLAAWLEVDEAILNELYPIVRDLLSFAQQLNRFAPELGREINLDALNRERPE